MKRNILTKIGLTKTGLTKLAPLAPLAAVAAVASSSADGLRIFTSTLYSTYLGPTLARSAPS